MPAGPDLPSYEAFIVQPEKAAQPPGPPPRRTRRPPPHRARRSPPHPDPRPRRHGPTRRPPPHRPDRRTTAVLQQSLDDHTPHRLRTRGRSGNHQRPVPRSRTGHQRTNRPQIPTATTDPHPPATTGTTPERRRRPRPTRRRPPQRSVPRDPQPSRPPHRATDSRSCGTPPRGRPRPRHRWKPAATDQSARLRLRRPLAPPARHNGHPTNAVARNVTARGLSHDLEPVPDSAVELGDAPCQVLVRQLDRGDFEPLVARKDDV